MAPAAKILSFWAVAPGAKGNADGLVISMVPSDAPGLTLEDSWGDCIGLRGTVSWSAKLDNVFIPWANVLGEPGDFVQKDPYTYECSHAAHLVGTAQGILDDIVDFVNARDYLATDEVLMYRMSEIVSGLQAARQSYYYAVWLWEQHRFDEAGLASLAALHAAKSISFKAANDAFDICGTRALFRFHRFERMWREVRASMLHTRDTQLMKYVSRGALAGGRQFSKLKYGEKVAHAPTWRELGFEPRQTVAAE
jgi:alkylation response protein AidB-like acyl-CoA dehydrogenase